MNMHQRISVALFVSIGAASCSHAGSGPSGPLPQTPSQHMRPASISQSGSSVVIHEYAIPGGGSPTGITAVNQTAAWFINGHKIGRFDTATHAIIQWNSVFRLGPDITPGPDNALWTVGNLPGGINAFGQTGNISEVVRLTQSGSWSNRVLPDGGYPYGSSAMAITHGMLNKVWYGLCEGCRDDSTGASEFGSVTPSFVFGDRGMPNFTSPGGFYYAIESMTRGSDGNLWLFADGGNVGSADQNAALLRVVPGAAHENAHWVLPLFGTAAGSVNSGPNALVWFTDPLDNAVGKISTTGTLVEYPVPSGNEPWTIGLNGDGLLYFTEPFGGRIGRINPSTNVIEEFPLPGGVGPNGLVGTVGKNVYFTAGDKIGVLMPQ